MSILRKFNICDLFIGLWGLYMLQGVLYPSGIINQMLQLIMILWGIILACKCLFSAYKVPVFFRALSTLLLMYIVYGTVLIISGNNVVIVGVGSPSIHVYLQNSLNSLLPIFVYYYYSRCGKLNEDSIRYYFIILVPLIIVLFISEQSRLLADMNQDSITNNVGYMFLSLLPYVCFFHKKPVFQYVIIGVLLTFVVLSVKRGAIMLMLLGVCFFMFSPFNRFSTSRRILNFILSSSLIIFAIYFVQYRLNSSEYFFSRIESTLQGNASGRDDIYQLIWEEVSQEKSFAKFLFGRGANSTISIAGNYAHQDWLETACNNGIIGVGILLYFFISLLSLLYRSRSTLTTYMFNAFIILYFITIAKTMFSMSIQNLDLSQSILLGYFAYLSGRSDVRLKCDNMLKFSYPRI